MKAWRCKMNTLETIVCTDELSNTISLIATRFSLLAVEVGLCTDTHKLKRIFFHTLMRDVHMLSPL